MTGRVGVVDLGHLGLDGAIAATLVLAPEPVLVDPGPATTLDALEAGLASFGVALSDLRHLCLTHIHLDHAGASGHLVARLPRLTVHVHEDGAGHLVDPERLVASTRRSFGEAHDRLWGEVLPVPAHRITAWRPGDPGRGRGRPGGLRALPTPGHIAHHLAWLDEDSGTLMAGDALGIVLSPEAPTHPASPPPAVDLAAWRTTLAELAVVGAEQAVVTHFGFVDDPARRIVAIGEALEGLAARVRRALAEGPGAADADALAFEAEVRERLGTVLGEERVEAYFGTFSAASDYAGVRRYLERHPGAAAAPATPHPSAAPSERTKRHR